MKCHIKTLHSCAGLKKVVVTEDGKVCSFPFVYRGREYHRCTTTERGRGWCATSMYQGIIVTWSFCAPDQGETAGPIEVVLPYPH